jgi:hypothetical protein
VIRWIDGNIQQRFLRQSGEFDSCSTPDLMTVVALQHVPKGLKPHNGKADQK